MTPALESEAPKVLAVKSEGQTQELTVSSHAQESDVMTPQSQQQSHDLQAASGELFVTSQCDDKPQIVIQRVSDAVRSHVDDLILQDTHSSMTFADVTLQQDGELTSHNSVGVQPLQIIARCATGSGNCSDYGHSVVSLNSVLSSVRIIEPNIHVIPASRK